MLFAIYACTVFAVACFGGRRCSLQRPCIRQPLYSRLSWLKLCWRCNRFLLCIWSDVLRWLAAGLTCFGASASNPDTYI